MLHTKAFVIDRHLPPIHKVVAIEVITIKGNHRLESLSRRLRSETILLRDFCPSIP